ncbi:unnamed protein product [Cuscuta epithymum]|uniref:Uncharacterized protein n=1 Tax=Cuscuta epithymum TaxID=186058 RepID=A0AAV0C9J0_9ASTE|nr:unnamed protein product [Cuscuta epithymum]
MAFLYFKIFIFPSENAIHMAFSIHNGILMKIFASTAGSVRSAATKFRSATAKLGSEVAAPESAGAACGGLRRPDPTAAADRSPETMARSIAATSSTVVVVAGGDRRR